MPEFGHPHQLGILCCSMILAHPNLAVLTAALKHHGRTLAPHRMPSKVLPAASAATPSTQLLTKQLPAGPQCLLWGLSIVCHLGANMEILSSCMYRVISERLALLRADTDAPLLHCGIGSRGARPAVRRDVLRACGQTSQSKSHKTGIMCYMSVNLVRCKLKQKIFLCNVQ